MLVDVSGTAGTMGIMGETRQVGSRFRRPLSAEEMGQVLAALRSGGRDQHGPAAAMVALWDIILTEAEGTTFAAAMAAQCGYHPNDYAIPRWQARELIAEMARGRRAQVRHGVRLAWNNSGPAVYDDDTDR